MTELAVYETFEEMFGRRCTLDELIRDIGSFPAICLVLCATIVTGVQLWDRVDSRPEAYASIPSPFFLATIFAFRFIEGYWSHPKRLLFHRRQLLLIAKLAILNCSGSGLDGPPEPTKLRSDPAKS